MNEVERYVAWVVDRLSQGSDVREEPDLELKSQYPSGPESEQVWAIADLIASMSNDPSLTGFRCVAYGPSADLQRPDWLRDEAQLGDKLRRYFDGAVVPRVELIRRQLGDRSVDLLVIVDRSEAPYVTRAEPGGQWVVRVRTNTARRTATRAELLALTGRRRPTGDAVRALDARLERWGTGTHRLVVANIGTIDVQDIQTLIPPDDSHQPSEWKPAFDLLKPGEKDGVPLILPRGLGRRPGSIRARIRGVAADGEPVEAEVLISEILS